MLKKEANAKCLLGHAPKSSMRFLNVVMKHSYTGKFEIIDEHRVGKIVVNLTCRLNKCEVISPYLMCNSKI